MAEARKIYLVTGINGGYLRRTDPYIRTMNSHSNVANVVLTLDFEIPEVYRRKYPSIRFAEISSADVRSPNVNSCMQHGGFLPALKLVANEDIIVYTDADISIQRGFSDPELDFLRSFGHDEVGVGYNRADNDTLAEEALRLKPTIAVEDLNFKYPGMSQLLIYNTGVLVANRQTYSALYDRYNQYWHDFAPLFERYGKQQWLLSYLIGRYFKPRILPDAIHTHGHYPVELRVKGEASYKFCIGSQLVVLNHAVHHEAENLVRRLDRQVGHLKRWVNRLVAALVIVTLICILLVVKDFF